MPGEVVTRTAIYSMGEDGIARVVSRPGAQETLADAQENLRALAEVVGSGRRVPALVDGRLLHAIDREARAFYAGPGFTQLVSAVAVIVGSPLTRTILNAILIVAKPRYPIRLFTTEAEALAWIRGLPPEQ